MTDLRNDLLRVKSECMLTRKMINNSNAYILGYSESILHEFNPRCASTDIVEGICRLQRLVDWMMHYG